MCLAADVTNAAWLVIMLLGSEGMYSVGGHVSLPVQQVLTGNAMSS